MNMFFFHGLWVYDLTFKIYSKDHFPGLLTWQTSPVDSEFSPGHLWCQLGWGEIPPPKKTLAKKTGGQKLPSFFGEFPKKLILREGCVFFPQVNSGEREIPPTGFFQSRLFFCWKHLAIFSENSHKGAGTIVRKGCFWRRLSCPITSFYIFYTYYTIYIYIHILFLDRLHGFWLYLFVFCINMFFISRFFPGREHIPPNKRSESPAHVDDYQAPRPIYPPYGSEQHQCGDFLFFSPFRLRHQKKTGRVFVDENRQDGFGRWDFSGSSIQFLYRFRGKDDRCLFPGG